jgi:hypothetical protein
MSDEEGLALVADSLMLPSDLELLLHSGHHPLATPLSSIPEMQWLQPLAAEWTFRFYPDTKRAGFYLT